MPADILPGTLCAACCHPFAVHDVTDDEPGPCYNDAMGNGPACACDAFARGAAVTQHPGVRWHAYQPLRPLDGGSGGSHSECRQCGYGPLAHRTDPTRDEGARINARRPRDDRNAPEV